MAYFFFLKRFVGNPNQQNNARLIFVNVFGNVSSSKCFLHYSTSPKNFLLYVFLTGYFMSNVFDHKHFLQHKIKANPSFPNVRGVLAT